MRDKVLMEMEREERAQRRREAFKEWCLKALFYCVVILIAVVLWVGARRTMEASEVHAATWDGWQSLGTWKLTAYCPEKCCNGKNAHRTASGAPMEPGRTVAAGSLPIGTELMIDGHIYVVEDRGVSGNHVDILFPDHKSALAFGVKYREVYVRR